MTNNFFSKNFGIGNRHNFLNAGNNGTHQGYYIYLMCIAALALEIVALCVYSLTLISWDIWQWVIGISVGIIVSLVLWIAYFGALDDDLAAVVGAFVFLALSVGNIVARSLLPEGYSTIFWCLTVAFFIDNLILAIINFVNECYFTGVTGIAAMLAQIVSIFIFWNK